MDKLAITKTVVNFVTCAGTAKIVSEVIKNNVTVETKIDKITVTAASIVISMAAKDKTRGYTSAKIDEFAAVWNKRKAVTTEETPEDVTV